MLIVSGPIRVFKDAVYPDFNPQDWPFISSKGFLNRFLAGHCFEIFLLLFIVINAFKLYLIKMKTPLLPTITQDHNDTLSNNDNVLIRLRKHKSDVHLLNMIKCVDNNNSESDKHSHYFSIQFLKLSIIYASLCLLIVWFFGVSIYERIHHYTGGTCLDHPNLKYYRQCVNKGFTYIGGFKCSGHSLITSTFTTCLVIECWSLLDWLLYINKINELSFKLNKIGNSILLISISVSFCWSIMYLVTCLFYHTFAERVVGTLCGCFIFYSVYIKCKL